MKKVLNITLAIIALGVINAHSQAPSKENLYTLLSDETLVYSENCFSFTDNGKDIFIVVHGNNGYYTINNGVRKGPYKEMNESLLKPCNQNNNSCSVFEPNGNSDGVSFDEYLKTNDDGTSSIIFKGKEYGPFMALQSFQFNSSKSIFIASAIEKDMSKKLIVSNGKTVPIDGMVSRVYFSPDGSQYLIKLGFDYTAQNIDPTKLNMDQMMSFTLLTSEGIKFGPFNGEKITESDIWFTQTTGNHWFLRNGDDLLLDGKPFMKMPENANRCDVWFSADCKRYAVTSYDKVRFSDNTIVPYPIITTLFYKDGKAYLRLITLENEKEINLYSKAL